MAVIRAGREADIEKNGELLTVFFYIDCNIVIL